MFNALHVDDRGTGSSIHGYSSILFYSPQCPYRLWGPPYQIDGNFLAHKAAGVERNHHVNLVRALEYMGLYTRLP
jgi:hypothetical protein